MKVIKITAVWCSACIIMNKIWNSIQDEYNIDTLSLDIDFDDSEVENYKPGEILPVIIFMKNDTEVRRIVGEHTKEELIKIIEEIGD